MTDPNRRWLSVADVMDMTGLSEATIRRRLADGSLPARKLGRRVLIDSADVDRLGATYTTNNPQ